MESRSYGHGSMYRRSVDGRWFGAVDVGGRGRRRRRTVSASSRAEVERRLRRLQARLGVDAETITVDQWLTSWLRDLLPGTVAAPTTMENYRWAIEHHLIPALGAIALVDLSPADVAGLLKTKLDDGYAVRSVGRLRTVLGAALADAVRDDVVDRNVARQVRGPRGHIARGRSLTLDQARILLASLDGERFEAALTIMLLLGLRPGEVLGLRWRDIDLAAEVLTVEHSLKREATGLRLGSTKTPQSRRRLALPHRVVEALLRRRARQDRERARAGSAWIERDFVFTTRTGGPVEHPRLRKDLATITARVGLGRWHPHELRHSAVSLLSAAGVRLEDVADLMGHRSTRTTSAVYRHVVVPVIDAAVGPTRQLYPALSGDGLHDGLHMAYTPQRVEPSTGPAQAG